ELAPQSKTLLEQAESANVVRLPCRIGRQGVKGRGERTRATQLPSDLKSVLGESCRFGCSSLLATDLREFAEGVHECFAVADLAEERVGLLEEGLRARRLVDLHRLPTRCPERAGTGCCLHGSCRGGEHCVEPGEGF